MAVSPDRNSWLDWRRRLRKEVYDRLRLTKEEWEREIPGSCRPFYRSVPSGAWANESCFIIGGGPSLTGFDFSRLSKYHNIAINRAWEEMPFAEIMFSMDSFYYRRLVEHGSPLFRRFKGHIVWLDTHGYPFKNIELLKAKNRDGVTISLENGIHHGDNSGYAGLNVAIGLGANPIYLLGFDMKYKGARTHWHSGQLFRTPLGKLLRYKKNFEHIAPKIRQMGIEVINLSPDSALECFRKVPVEEVL